MDCDDVPRLGVNRIHYFSAVDTFHEICRKPSSMKTVSVTGNVAAVKSCIDRSIAIEESFNDTLNTPVARLTARFVG